MRLWCRAGISIDDFYNARQILAAACWATDVQITVSPRHAHLVTVDVIRSRRPEQQLAVPPERPAAPGPTVPWERPAAPEPVVDVPAPQIPAQRQPVD